MKLSILYSKLLSEGKFPITDDMKRVASEVATKVYNINTESDTNNVLIGNRVEHVYERYDTIVDGGKYGKKKCVFYISKFKKFGEKDAYAYTISDAHYGLAGHKSSIVVYHTPNIGSTHNDYYYNILHELIHVFDPKLNRPDLMRKFKARKQNLDYFKYVNTPQELDAHISTLADSLIDFLSKNKRSIQGVAAFLRNMDENLLRTLPMRFYGLIHIKRKPTSWHRFVKALQKSYDDLVSSNKLKNDKFYTRDASVNVDIFKTSFGKFYYKIPERNYVSDLFSTKEELRSHASRVADAISNW